MTATIEEAARHYAARDPGQAALVCLDILRADPRHFDALHLLGVICTNRGQHAGGVSYLLRADAARPNDPRLLANLGASYGAMQRFDKAVEAYQRALALGYRDAGVLNNMGLALRGLDQREEALDALRAAIVLDPGNDPALYNLARAKIASGHLADGEADFRLLRDRLPPETPAERIIEVTNELARVVADLGRAEEALEILRAAIARQPEVASFRWHEALLLLLMGRFREGWAAYETRWESPGHDRPHPDHRVLDLDQVAGMRVLVKEEQGRGDVIQFLRYIPPLAARGARIRLSVYPDLIPLAREMADVELVLGPDEDEAEYDLMTTVISLPMAFATDFETIPARVPYLRAPAARIGRMKNHLGLASGRRIGLAWSGSIASRARSAMAAAALEPLLQSPGMEFHCLQKEIGGEDHDWLDRTGQIATHEAMLRDFGDTAALIDAMDLVISVDTAVAHLAGALAKPVWVLLAFNPDWRWLLGRDDSPWYPTARLFRQQAPGDWDSVAGSVAAALQT
jgi:tetratricopeptide (TPR) repeat protein